MTDFRIGDRPVGSAAPVLVMAEVAQAHDGSLGHAHALIDAVARSGADAIKFQTHIAAAESSRAEPWRVPFSYRNETRFDYWCRMEFSTEEWSGLKQHARDRGLAFVSSAFSAEAVDLLASIGADALKVASGEVGNEGVLSSIRSAGLPVILSTGMSYLAEIDAAVERLQGGPQGLAVLQCTSEYPCPPEDVGLNVMDVLRGRYRLPVGLSDHSGTIFPSIIAAYAGADVIEVHVTLSRDMFGPDVPASVTVSELADLVGGVRFARDMAYHPVDKDAVARGLEPLRVVFGHSLVASRDLAAGSTLAVRDLVVRKPGGGYSPDQLASVVGRVLRRPVLAGEQLLPSMLE